MRFTQLTRRIFFIVVFLFLFYPLFSQTDSTAFIAKAKNVVYVFANDINTFFPIDTSLKNFQFTDPIDKEFGNVSLGNLGQPYYSLVFHPDQIRGFDIGLHSMDAYRLKLEETPFYHNTYSYSELNYVLGLRAEQLVNAKVSQRFGEQMNAGVEFQRLSSTGTYLNQETGNYNMRFFDWYRSKNERYNLMTAVAVNWINANINGGVDTAINLEDSFFLSKKIVPINLDGASIKWNDAGGFIQQSWDFGKKYDVLVDTSVQKVFQPKSRLTHQFKYQNHVYRFTDEFPDSSFYHGFGIWVDPNDTLISELEYDEFSNQLSYSFLGVKYRANDAVVYKPFVFDILLSHHLFEVYSDGHKTFQNLNAELNIGNNKRYNYNLLYGLNAWYSFIDYNQGDYDINAHFGIYWHGQGEFLIGAQMKNAHPNFLMRVNDPFTEMIDRTSQFSRFYIAHQNARTQIKAEISYTNQINYPFWFYDHEVVALEGHDIHIWQFSLLKEFILGKFHFDNQFVYQTFSNKEIIHLPEFVARANWYYQNNLFKSAMLLQAGVTANYNSDFFAPAYAPVIQQFYLQDTIKYHYTPTVDVFVNMRIKRARLFFVLENALQGAYQNIQYGAHLYPTADRTFRGGISWKFYD